MDAEQRKNQILDCAKKLFSMKGYYQTQITDIQHAAGVARGTIYQYFKNKDDIFETLLDRFHEDWKRVLSQKPEDPEKVYGSGLEVFKFRVKQTFKFFAGEPDYCNILLRIHLGLGQNFDRAIKRFDSQMVDLLNTYLIAGIKLGRIKENIDIELMTNLIGGAFMRMAYYYGVTKKGKKKLDVDALTDKFVNAFAYGIFSEKG